LPSAGAGEAGLVSSAGHTAAQAARVGLPFPGDFMSSSWWTEGHGSSGFPGNHHATIPAYSCHRVLSCAGLDAERGNSVKFLQACDVIRECRTTHTSLSVLERLNKYVRFSFPGRSLVSPLGASRFTTVTTFATGIITVAKTGVVSLPLIISHCNEIYAQ
jgi:hypothetical protein